MAEPSDTTPKKPNVVEEIVNAGTKAFNPSNDGATRDAGRHEYDQVIQRYALQPTFLPSRGIASANMHPVSIHGRCCMLSTP
mgnify:CR=1 FL=1